MKLNQLPKTTNKPGKRIGRGYGSGVGGHTSTRGQKGQNARGTMAKWFEGGQLPQIRRFPFIRGKSRFEALKPKPILIDLNQLNRLTDNQEVTPKTLIDAGLVSVDEISVKPVKIVGWGVLKKALTITVPISKRAEAKIKAAGGTVKRESTD